MMYYEIVSQISKDANTPVEAIVASEEASTQIHKYWFYRYERGYSTLVENVKTSIKEGN